MAHHFTTTHDASGKSVFSSKVPEDRHVINMPGMTMEIIYTSHVFKPDMSKETDIDQYAHDRTNGLPNHAVCLSEGVAAAIVSMEPESTSPMHRTLSMDVLVMIEGVVELHLDEGEVRTLKQGDSITQRATMHQWKNVTPNGGWARMAGFATPIVEPLEIGGKRLETEFRTS